MTLTVPALYAGVVTMIVAELLTVTVVAEFAPKVTVAPDRNPAPVSVTLDPPAMEPEVGLIAVRVGGTCGSKAPMLHCRAGRGRPRWSTPPATPAQAIGSPLLIAALFVPSAIVCVGPP